jgi:hypothetical protein
MREARCMRRRGSFGRDAAKLRSSVEFEGLELPAQFGPVGLECPLGHRVEHALLSYLKIHPRRLTS